jgi:hypothetical protein
LALQGNWSDINQNGLGEFAVTFQYCPQGCLENGVAAVHFYEITNTYQVVDITADLPGVIHPGKMVQSRDPLTLWVHDLLAYDSGAYLQTAWIYAWEGAGYVDVSRQYAQAYQAQIDQIVTGIQAAYDAPLTTARLDMLAILLLSNKAKLPQQPTLTTFLQVSDPSRWPGTGATTTCWLQLGRAYAQRDAGKGRPFSLPPNETTINGPALEDILAAINQNKYDLSACTQ